MNISKTRLFALILGTLWLIQTAKSQDRIDAQKSIEELCSESFYGRGYINKGDSIAAAYLKDKFLEIGLLPGDSNFYHHFALDVNTIPKTYLSIDGTELKPGTDYIVSPASNSSFGQRKILYFSERLLESDNAPKKIRKAIRKGYLPVIGLYDHNNKKVVENIKEIRKCNVKSTLVFLKENLTWSVSRVQNKGSEIWIMDSVFNKYSQEVNYNIEAKFIKNYNSQNVIGYVPGTKHLDSFIIICGHYDHLGMMGEALYSGANDNASGIAMLLDMAKYFKTHPQKFSIVFIGFAGEEAGLVGSFNYVSDPPQKIPLAKTKFVFNMDLMGSGELGATIVNGSIYSDFFNGLTEINTGHEYLPLIKARGKAANSDHYYFSEVGIPSFFIYLMGDYTHYHIPADNPLNLKLGSYYDKSFMLIRDFIIFLNN